MASAAIFLAALAARCTATNLPFMESASRSAVPVLCTANQNSGQTKIRGSAVVVDTSGIILTAAHVVTEVGLACTLTVLVPDADWSRTRAYHPFSVERCFSVGSLDIAACQIRPLAGQADMNYLRAAPIDATFPADHEIISVIGFWGWGGSPLVRRGKVLGHRSYRRRDGVFCDFSTDVAVFEGMSGSPVQSEDGHVVGLITTAGVHSFAGTSFGISFEQTRLFLIANGLTAEASRQQRAPTLQRSLVHDSSGD
jgi:hypothetical protein